MRTSSALLATVTTLHLAGCTSTLGGGSALRAEVQAYLDVYNARYRELVTASEEADWVAQTRIVEGDDANDLRVQAADEALAAFTGSVENIEKARGWLAREGELSDMQVRQLRAMLYRAGGNPQTVAALVKERIKAETAQT